MRGFFTELSFLVSDELVLVGLVGEVSFGFILSLELGRSLSFSLLRSRWYCRGLECTPGRVAPSGDTAVAVTFDTDDLGNFGMGGRLDTDNFFEAGPLTTPGLSPEVDFVEEVFVLGDDELLEDEDDLEALPSFTFALLIVNFNPPVEGLIVNSGLLSVSFLLSLDSGLEGSF